MAVEPDFFTNRNGSLEPSYPYSPGFKTDFPETSRTAANSTSAETLRAKVLVELRKGNKTSDEIASAIGESILSIRPRVSELAAMGKVLDSRERRFNESGKRAAVWKVLC